MKSNSILGKLYLIPTTLGDCNHDDVLPISISRTIDFIDYFIVENEKTARKFIKTTNPSKVQASLQLFSLNKHTEIKDHLQMLQPCLEGKNIGLMSEAGCPGVADPGAVIVKLAHEKGIQVVPMVGPSSILLAIMASGMNGQSFAFNGYIPIDKTEKRSVLKSLEKLSADKNQSQIFIETPYRNAALLHALLQTLQGNTRLALSCGLTLEAAWNFSAPVSNWKKNQPIAPLDLPTVFCIGR